MSKRATEDIIAKNDTVLHLIGYITVDDWVDTLKNFTEDVSATLIWKLLENYDEKYSQAQMQQVRLRIETLNKSKNKNKKSDTSKKNNK